MEQQYLDLCRKVLDEGVEKEDRTKTGTISIFGHQMRFNVGQVFPLLTTKDVNFKNVLGELLAFRDGETNANNIANIYGFKIWRKWQLNQGGDLGPIYGSQWRSWPALYNDGAAVGHIDQLAQVINEIKNNPDGRRHIVSAWNVGALDDMALPPCHLLFQFYVANGKLSLQLYQRSGDLFLGVPYNIASYSALLMMVAQVCDLEPHEFIHTLGDVHIYKNHLDQVREQIKRDPKPLPTLKLNPEIKNIDDFWFDDFEVVGYNPHPAIKGEVSV